jgi:hypothetical protein
MRKHSDAFCGSNFGQHLARGKTLSEERNRSPYENVNSIRCVAVFNARDHEDAVGTCLSTCASVFAQALRRKTAVVFGHHEHAAAALAKLFAQRVERPTPVI